ncbi:MAG: hypothetical protein U1E76_25005 [Planctomycetota bacterium]
MLPASAGDARTATAELPFVAEPDVHQVAMPVPPATPTKDPQPHEVRPEPMSAREEVSLKITEGLKGLSNILTDIDTKLDDQNRKSTEIVQSIKVLPEMMRDLPETSRAGIELLSVISRVLEDQTRATRDMVDRVKEMPTLVARVSSHLEEQSRVLSRQEDARMQLETAVQGVGSAVLKLADQQQTQEARACEKLEQVENRTLEELRRMQAQHERHLSDLSQRSTHQMRVITIMTVLIVLVFLAVLTHL